jgi:hypothetical protein
MGSSSDLGLVIGIALTMGKKRAYCSANDWATAFEKPTAFCAVQGHILYCLALLLYHYVVSFHCIVLACMISHEFQCEQVMIRHTD